MVAVAAVGERWRYQSVHRSVVNTHYPYSPDGAKRLLLLLLKLLLGAEEGAGAQINVRPTAAAAAAVRRRGRRGGAQCSVNIVARTVAVAVVVAGAGGATIGAAPIGVGGRKPSARAAARAAWPLGPLVRRRDG